MSHPLPTWSALGTLQVRVLNTFRHSEDVAEGIILRIHRSAGIDWFCHVAGGKCRPHDRRRTVFPRLATLTAKRRVRLKWLRAAWCETFCHALCTTRDSWLHCGFCSVRNRAESISVLALTWRRLLHCAAEGVCPGQSSSRHKFGDHLCVGFPAHKRKIVFCTLEVA